MRFEISQISIGGIQRAFPAPARPLHNSLVATYFRIEGSPEGLSFLAGKFVQVARYGKDIHLDPVKGANGDFGYFRPGVEVIIADGKWREPRAVRHPPYAFLYESSPVEMPETRNLKPGSECWTQGGARNEPFVIDGNSLALTSLAEHLLDLANQDTPSGVELVYESCVQLLPESVPFRFRRA